MYKQTRILLTLAMLFCWVGNTLAAIQLTDATDTVVELDQPAKRIIALAPHIVENVYTAGAGEYLVGAVSYSNFPEAAKQLPEIGSYKHINQESLLALKPDLVLAWHSGNGAAMIQRLRQLGLTVFVYEPKETGDVAAAIRTIGTLAGTEVIAEQEADRYEAVKEALKAKYQNAETISVLYQVWNSPLQTLNDNHVISDVIRLCGGINVFGKEKILAPVISREAVLIENPQVIIASGMGESRPEWLDEWHQWPSLQAVKSDQLYFVPPDHIQRHTVRLLLGAEAICHALDDARQYYSKPNK